MDMKVLVKMFTDDMRKLETEINSWVEDTGATIVDIKELIKPEAHTLIVTYIPKQANPFMDDMDGSNILDLSDFDIEGHDKPEPEPEVA